MVKANIRGRRLSQILLTGSRTLNILFYYPIKKRRSHMSMSMSITSLSELDLSLITFAGSDSTLT